jgi:hypothetical protein
LALAGAGDAAAEHLEIWSPVYGPRVIPSGPVELSVVRVRDEVLVPVGELELETSHGEVVLAPIDDPYVRRVVLLPPPRTSARVEVSARAGPLAAQLALDMNDAVMGRVVVRADPPTLVKGRADAALELSIETLDPSGAPAGDVRPRLFTNTGTVSAARQIAPGRFTASYRPSDAPFPEVGVVVAVLPWPHEASASVSLGEVVIPQPAAVNLPGETKPGVEMTVEIAGETYGPVRADDQGRFRVPVVVPPGVGRGLGLSRDRFGNVRRKPLDLRLPPTQRLALAAHPRVLVADGASHALIVLSALEPDGAMAEGKRPRLVAARGRVGQPVETSPGVFHAWYVAPAELGDGEDLVEATLPRDKVSRAQLRMKLVAGAPDKLDTTVQRRLLTVPGDDNLVVKVKMEDARGHAVGDGAYVTDVRHGVAHAEDGALVYRPPGSARAGSDRISLRAFARSDRPAVRLAFAPPTTLVAVDALGRPVAGAPVVAEGRTTYSDAEGRVTLPASSGVIEVHLPGSKLPTLLHLAIGDDGQLHGAPAAPPTLERVIDLTLMEPRDVLVFATVQDRDDKRVRLRWRVDGAPGPIAVLVGRKQVATKVDAEGTVSVDALPGDVITVAHPASGTAAIVMPSAPTASDAR